MQLTIFQKIKAIIIGVPPVKKSIRQTPEDFNMPYQNVTFQNEENNKISAWLINKPNAQGTVMLLHGYNANKGDMLHYAKFLYKNNYSVFLIDFRGAGESGGNYNSAGFKEKEDVILAVQYLESRNDVNTNRLFGLGVSMGGSALVFAQKEDKMFNAIILDSVYSSLYQNIANRFNFVYGLPKFPFATSITFFGGLLFNTNGFNVAPVKYIDEIGVPILIIQGDSDNSVSTIEAEQLYDRAMNPKYLWLVKGAGHAQSYETHKQVYESQLLGFFDNI